MAIIQVLQFWLLYSRVNLVLLVRCTHYFSRALFAMNSYVVLTHEAYNSFYNLLYEQGYLKKVLLLFA